MENLLKHRRAFFKTWKNLELGKASGRNLGTRNNVKETSKFEGTWIETSKFVKRNFEIVGRNFFFFEFEKAWTTWGKLGNFIKACLLISK